MAIASMTTLLFALGVFGVSSLSLQQSVYHRMSEHMCELTLPDHNMAHPMSPHVCDQTHPDHNTMQCMEGALGMTIPHLQKKIFNASKHELVYHGCRRNVKVFTINEMEAKFPELAKCKLSTYAAVLQNAVQSVNCQVQTIDEADAIYIPAYLANQCYWPLNGGINCCPKENIFREGKICRREELEAADMLMKEHGKPVIISDVSSYGSITGHSTKLIWAKNGLMTHEHKEHHAISLAPAPTYPRCRYCSENPTQADECYGTRLDKKKYKLSFKGTMANNPIRYFLRKYHNPKERVVIVGTEDNTYDFDELLHNSVFVLILEGDCPFSYRFTEAVCSGGIPVLVTERWVPPFEDSIPFDRYGIEVKETDAFKNFSGVVAKLDNYNMTDLEEMRQHARTVCENSFKTVYLQGKKMISEALSIM